MPSRPPSLKRAEVEFDVFAGRGALLVARAARPQDAPRDVGDGLLDVVVGPNSPFRASSRIMSKPEMPVRQRDV
jgi:hypothetical protein